MSWKTVTYSLAFAFTFLTFCFAQSSNLVVNGDFENGNTGFTSDFVFSPGNITPASTYDVVTDPRNSHGSAATFGDNTSGIGLMMALNGSTDSDSVFWRQLVNVAPNTNYEFDLWSATWFSTASIQVTINSEVVGNPFFTPASRAVWEKNSFVWNSGSSTTANIELVNQTSNFVGNDFAIDDISFTEVPAPVILGDVNMDGVVNFSDIPAFIAVLSSGEFQAEADADESGEVDFSDIPPFIEILISQ